MNRLRLEVGFWGSVGRLKLKDLFSFEYLSSLVLGVGIAVLLSLFSTPAEREAVAGDYLVIAAALVGVVFAGMALVVALMSDAYMRLLAESDSGVTGFLSPFMLALGLQVSSVLLSVGYRAFAGLLPVLAEQIFFGVISVLFIASALEIVVLARNVFMHARLRVQHQRVTVLEHERIRRQKSSNGD